MSMIIPSAQLSIMGWKAVGSIEYARGSLQTGDSSVEYSFPFPDLVWSRIIGIKRRSPELFCTGQSDFDSTLNIS
jgi:hypothetical protein